MSFAKERDGDNMKCKIPKRGTLDCYYRNGIKPEDPAIICRPYRLGENGVCKHAEPEDNMSEKCILRRPDELKDGGSLAHGLDSDGCDIVIGFTADMDLFKKSALPHDTIQEPIRSHMRATNEDDSSEWMYVFCDPKEAGAFDVIFQLVQY